MKYFKQHRSWISLVAALMLLLISTFQAQASESTNDLAAKIVSLKLGIDEYTIGSKLPGNKKDFAKTHRQDDAYEGTYKFNDGELFVVVSAQDDTILALYQRQDDAGFDQAKKMVSGLMGLYGDPTTMAHDKLVYWAYGDQGKIGEENYNTSREENKPLDILATVKFSSDFEITSEEEQKQNGTIYFIISSDPLTSEFMKQK